MFKLGNINRQTSVGRNVYTYEYKTEQYEIPYDPVLMNWNGKVDIEVYDYESAGNNRMVGTATVEVLIN